MLAPFGSDKSSVHPAEDTAGVDDGISSTNSPCCSGAAIKDR
jgi:hypothetical protein